MDGLPFNVGDLVQQEGTFSVILGQCPPMSLRGTAGLADRLRGTAVPDTPLPVRLGMPPAPDSVCCMLGWQQRCTMREAECSPYFEGWHFEGWCFERCRLPPALGTQLHRFRLCRAEEVVHTPDRFGLAGATPVPLGRADFPCDHMSLQIPHENWYNLKADLLQEVFMRLV